MGVQDGMASGEAPVSLVSTNMQIGITSALVSASGNSVLSTPPTASQLAYGAIQPKITLGPAGISSCSFRNGYAHMSALQWSRNPFSDSSAVKSSLVRVVAVDQTTDVMVHGVLRSLVDRSSAAFTLPGVPAYTIAQQFSSTQNFNFSAINSGTIATTRGKTNFTLPECTVYNGVAYVPCKGCNISSYTNYNVTYGCFDITQLCQSDGLTRYLQLEEEVEEASQKVIAFVNIGEGGRDGRFQQRGRSLDSTTTTKTSSTYGVLFRSIATELNSVLSVNPFTLDLVHSTGVLAFTGCLGGAILFMLLYFLRWDDREKIQKKYIKAESVAMARKLLEEDLKNGGKGDLSVAYQEHIRKLKKRFKSDLSIMETIGRKQSEILMFGSQNSTAASSFSKHSPNSPSSSMGSDFDYSDIVVIVGDQQETRSNSEGDAESVFDGRHYELTIAVTDFLHKLFPGNSIFTKKRNALEIISVYHDYYKMFSGSAMSHTRTIRFLNLVILILVCVFADTVFFGIFFPVDSPCFQMTSEVKLDVRAFRSIRFYPTRLPRVSISNEQLF